ncbi:karyogamy protein, partial [Lineolata rhizophorae]
MDLANGDASDRSSIISTSDRLAPSDSEHSDIVDHQKYIIPEGKSTKMSTVYSVSQSAASAGETPPTPPPKDHAVKGPRHFATKSTTSVSSSMTDLTNGASQSAAPPFGDDSSTAESYFNPYNLSRANSVYSLSRVSFTNQIQQLTSIKLPQASSLAEHISAIPTSGAAARALSDAAEQIRRWISKASEVLSGLDAEDDVEWAAAGGREGLGEVDAAVNRFESLITVYVGAIEELQSRKDVASVPARELQKVVEQMENILAEWKRIKKTLKEVKEQVEVAMEWEELWNNVLGEIGLEVDALGRLIFEMEERRHRAVMADSDPGNSLDLGELETIVEEAPAVRSLNAQMAASGAGAGAGSRLSLAAIPQSTSPASPSAQTAQDDSNLLALFARMQPLRASLDFLPMRLSSFLMRGSAVFPTSCDELERRRDQLEGQWKKLEADAEALRRELGEDRWILVFRNAGRQALKMCESVSRSLAKLREAIEDGSHHTNLPATAKKIESYEAKKMHYGPAIERVLAIIDRGVNDRLTVNGEVLRLQADMRRRWEELGEEMKGMDFVLEELQMNRSQQLRDSISTILSTDRSVASASSAVDTPGSSPASSVVLMSRKSSDHGISGAPGTPYGAGGKARQGSFAGSGKPGATGGAGSKASRRYSSLPTPSTSASGTLPRKPVGSAAATATATKSSTIGQTAAEAATASRPRWNSSTNMKDTIVGHNFKPLSATTPSPHRKQHGAAGRSAAGPAAMPPRTLRSVSSHSAIPVPSPLSRSTNSSSGGHGGAAARPPSTTPMPPRAAS